MGEIIDLTKARTARTEQQAASLVRLQSNEWLPSLRSGWGALQTALAGTMGNPALITRNSYYFPPHQAVADVQVDGRLLRGASVAVHVSGILPAGGAANDEARAAIAQLARDEEAGVTLLPRTRGRLFEAISTATSGYHVELHHADAPYPTDFVLERPVDEPVTQTDFANILQYRSPAEVAATFGGRTERDVARLYEVAGLLATADPHRVG